MANKDNSERIERFLRDQMSPEENQAFLDDLKSDKELLEEAQMMALLIKGMKEEQEEMENEIKEGIKGEDETTIAANIPSIVADTATAANVPPVTLIGTNPTASRKPKWIYWAGAVAAMFILVFGAIKLFNSQDNVKLNQPTPNLKTTIKDKKQKIIKKHKKTSGQKDSTENKVNTPPTVIEDPSNNTDIAGNDAESNTEKENKEEVNIKVVDESSQIHQAAP